MVLPTSMSQTEEWNQNTLSCIHTFDDNAMPMLWTSTQIYFILNMCLLILTHMRCICYNSLPICETSINNGTHRFCLHNMLCEKVRCMWFENTTRKVHGNRCSLNLKFNPIWHYHLPKKAAWNNLYIWQSACIPRELTIKNECSNENTIGNISLGVG